MSQLDLGVDLAPAVRQLGLLIGILEDVQDAAPSGAKTVLNQRWFEDPLKELGKIPTDAKRRNQLFEAIGEVAPGRDGWHDLWQGTLFLVRKRDSLVGVGCRKVLSFDKGKATVSLFLPLVDLKGGNPPLAEPLELTVAMEATGESVVQSLALSASLSFQGKASVELEVGLLRKGKRETLSLAELLDHPEKLVGLLTDLLVEQVGHQYPAAAQLLERLNRLLGIGEYGVFKGKAFFIDLASGPGLKEWLSAVADLMGSGAVTGAGAEEDPYRLLLYPLGLAGGIHLTVGGSGANLRLGMTMTTDAARLAPGLGVQLRVQLGLMQLRRSDLTPDFSKPVLLFDVTLTNPAASRAVPRPLFEYLPMHWIEGAPKEYFAIGSMHCGLRVEPGEAFDAARLPFLRVEDVHYGWNEPGVDYDLLHDGLEAIRVLECFGKALEVQYAQSRFNKSSTDVLGRDFGALVEDGFALSAANSALERFAKLAGTKVGIGGVTEALTGLARWLAGGDVERRLALWLEEQVAKGMVFEAAGELLSLCDDSLCGKDGRLVFRAADEVEFGLGGSGAGLSVSLKAGYSMDALRFQVEGSLGIPFSGGAPEVGLSATLQPGESAVWSLERAGFRGRPEMRLALTRAGASGSVTVRFPDDVLTVDLMPTLAWKRNAVAMAAEAWLLVLGTRVLEELLEEKLLNDASVVEMLNKDLGLGIVPGAVLVELHLLTKAGDRYRFGSLSGISAANVLNALLKSGLEEPPATDGVWLLLRKNGTVSVFIRKEFKVGARSLQLGRWLEGETDAGNWLGNGKKPGVELILGKKTDESFRFQPGIELVSVGIDAGGAKGEALFSVQGVALQKVKARIHLQVGAGASTTLAGALELNEFSMPLGPKAGGPGQNAVAANLLGDGGADASGKPAENPAFSAVVSYVDGFKARITGNIVPAADGMAWVPLNRSFGPMRVRKLGLGFKGKTLNVGYDGAVSLSSLNVELDHLTAGIPLNDPTNFARYELDLAGLALSLSSGPVQITGGLFKAGGGDQPVRYDGLALIKAQSFTVSGFGSYAMVSGAPSLFVYAALYQDIGGPSWFHVTGLAAGFGYNRALQLPPVEKVHEFPLVRAALDESYISGAGQAGVNRAMEVLATYASPSLGEYWLAIGVRFTSFEIVQSFALLSVAFGREVEIGLLGMSTMTLPRRKGPDDKTPIVAYVEMALRAVIRPSEGSIAVEGRLTDNSYILDTKCKLTGGFAFFAWFSGAHAGDFVVTVGGYHPRFIRPSHYPVVPRLALNWKLDDNLTISGEEYFALTPSCLMLGGKLRAVYRSGSIEAWFTAYADILLSWQPFYYLVEMGVSIGVACSLRINLLFVSFTLSLRVELSVDLRLCGPPFSGEVRVDLSVISFTIRFGEPPAPPKALDRKQFVEAFLPVQKTPMRAGMLRADTAVPVPDTITLQIASGLLCERTGDNGATVRIVNAHAFSAVAQSVVPSRRFTSTHWKQTRTGEPCGIRPMGVESLDAEFAVSVRRGNTELAAEEAKWLEFELIEAGVPSALWGKGEPGKAAPPSGPSAEMVNATVGVRMFCTAPEPTHSLPPMLIEELLTEQLEDKVVHWIYRTEAGEPIPDKPGVSLDNTIWGNRVVDERRGKILDALKAASPFTMNTPELAKMQENVRDQAYFQEMPRFAYLGETLH